VVGVLVYPLDLDHLSLHQRSTQGPSGFRGRQEALPPGDGPASVLVPSIGSVTPVPHPQLQHGHLQAHCPHDKEVRGLLAQGPEMDHELLCVHSGRTPHCGGMPLPTRPPPRIQVLPGLLKDNVLPL